VVVRYIAGVDPSLRVLLKNPFAGPTPTYYIWCDKCGENKYIRVGKPTVSHRDHCRRILVRDWNEEMSADENL
jgi:hypothetical protein